MLSKLWDRRSNLRYPTKDLLAALTGDRGTVSGERINPRTALGISAYFGGIRAISDDVGKLPCFVYRRLERGREKLPEHPVSHLLNVAPNEEMSAMSFRSTLHQHSMNWGNGYAAIQYEGDLLTPHALWPLHPSGMSLWRLDNGDLEYRFTDESGVHRFTPRQIFHLHGLGPDGLTGYSIAELARESLGLAVAQEKSGAGLFGNGSRPGGVLNVPRSLTPEKHAELKTQWRAMYGGAKNTAQTAVLEGDMVFTPIAQPHKDSQWIEARQFSVEEICRWLRMSPVKLQHLLRATYDNIDAENTSYVVDTLGSPMTYFEQEVVRRLLTPKERRTLYVKHNADALMRGDPVKRHESYQKAIYGGWKTPDEVRELDEMNPLPAGQNGDKAWRPVNMLHADEKLEQSQPAPDSPLDRICDPNWWCRTVTAVAS